MPEIAYSRNQVAVRLLARDILCREVGERLPTALQYQELIEVGSGTVQKALRVLQSAGAVALRARGHQGTFIVERHVGPLWAIAGLGAAIGVLPLTDCTEGWGLAAGLREQFDALGVPLQMLYLHGAAHRVEMVRGGRADFVVLSRAAVDQMRTATAGSDWLELDLGPHSYYSHESMVVLLRPHVAEEGPAAIRRVGIDPDSSDHMQLTRAEFPEAAGYDYQPHAHGRLLMAVAQGAIDAAVWHRTSLLIPPELAGIGVRPLQQQKALDLFASLSRATLLAPTNKQQLSSVLRHLDLARIRDTQARLLRDEIAPVY
jgi:hypothetical protein